MPFKTIFRNHKKIKQSTKRGVHFTPDHHVHMLEKPPDGEQILDQIQHMKLHKQRTSSRGHSNVISISTSGLVPPPLYRAATAPLPVTSHTIHGSVGGSGTVRKSSSLGESLNSRHTSEFDLHDRRLKDLTQLESYISYLQHTSDDDAFLYMSNRLCCAQVLKTLFMRHEQPYVNLLYGKSPNSPSDMTQTKHLVGDEKRDACSTVCDTCLTPLDDDFVFLPDVAESDGNCGEMRDHDDIGPTVRKSILANEPISNFHRQRGNRVPVVTKRRGHKVSLSLTPAVCIPSPDCPLAAQLGGGEDDPCERIDKKCSLDNVASDTTVNESSGENKNMSSCTSTSDMSRCSSDLSLTPFASISVFPGCYEIY